MDIKAPVFPESITEGTVAVWHKGANEPIQRDDLLVDIETDKVVLEVVAPADGRIVEICRQEGDVVESEALLAVFEAGDVSDPADAPAADASAEPPPVSASPAARKLGRGEGPGPCQDAGHRPGWAHHQGRRGAVCARGKADAHAHGGQGRGSRAA